MAAQTIYDFTLKTLKGKEFNFLSLKNKVILIVNVASHCGYTSQYKGLESLYLKYKDNGLEIIGFPCNQFGSQEPGTEEEISTFCSRTYNVTFPILQKVDVNGDDAAPIYKYLKSQDVSQTKIKWNFEKFLIDKNGNVVNKYTSAITPEQLDEKIKELL